MRKVKEFRLWLKRVFCKHEFQADKQLCFVICKHCYELHWYEKEVDCRKLLAKHQSLKEN